VVHIGLDIGGSKVSIMAQDEAGKILAYQREPIQKNYTAFLAQIFDLTKQFTDKSNITLGIAIPGRVLKGKNNFTVNPANLPFLKEKDFGQDLKAHFGFLPAIENDANCFTLSEAVEGAGKDHDYVFGLIIGTGVGGGLAFKGNIIAGRHGIAGEWGHIPLPKRRPERDGDPMQCGCGQTGCLCPELSGGGIQKRYGMLGGNASKSVEEILTDKQNGDAIASKTFDLYFDSLAENLTVLIGILDPEVIVMGGGLTHIPNLADELKSRIGKGFWTSPLTTEIKLAQFNADSGVRGALHLGKQSSSQNL
jgi:fructokinase